MPLERQPDRPLRWRLLCAGQRRLKVGHIQGERGVGPPLQGLHACVEIGVRIRQGVAQVVQQVAQVGAGLGFGGVGPEEEGQVRTGLGSIPVQQQVCQQ